MLLSRSPQEGLQVVELTATTVVLIFVALFAYLGYRRDVRRNLMFFGGLLVATLLCQVNSKPLVPIVNRLARLLLFAVKGGVLADNPLPIWEAVKKRPPLVNVDDPQNMLWFNTVVFVVLGVFSYWLGNRLWRGGAPDILAMARSRLEGKKSKKSVNQMVSAFFTQLTGTVVGGLNGFLVAMFFIPRYLAATKTLVVIPGTAAWDLLTRNLRYAIVVVLLVFIVRGWQQAKKR